MTIAITILFLVLSGITVRSFSFSRMIRILNFVFGLVLIFLSSLETISDRLTGMGFNDAVVFHLQYGLEGAGIKSFLPLIFVSILALGSIISIWAYVNFRRARNPKHQNMLAQYLLPSFGMLGIIFHPTFHSILNVLLPPLTSQPLVDFYVAPHIDGRPSKKPNVVWVYGESLERTYLDEKEFPGLMPNLKALEKQSLSFTDIAQVGSTGWTIAGIVASQCGIPLVTMGGTGNSMESMPTFLPGATCLGDLLKRENYELTFMGGASSVFAGKGKFLSTHGFKEVLGWESLSKVLSNPNYHHEWGLFDDSLFTMAHDKYRSLLSKHKPFGLFLLTIDTHSPGGFASQACANDPYGDGSNRLLNAVHCTDILLGNLVDMIHRTDPNTMIVIGSDHLAMNNTVYDRLNRRDRKDLLLLNWPGHIKPAINNRPETTFSSGAIVLGSMGFETDGIGLGRSLAQTTPSLRETFAEPNKTVNGWENEFRKFWYPPKAPSNLHIDPLRRFVSFSGSLYPVPIIVDISPKDKFTRIFLENPDESLSDIITKLPTETRSLWVDNCGMVKATIANENDDNPVEYCIWDDKLKKITRLASVTEYALDN